MKKTLLIPHNVQNPLYFLLFLLLFSLCNNPSYCQPPSGIQYQRILGGSRYDQGKTICKTNDGGVIVGSDVSSNDGDIGPYPPDIDNKGNQVGYSAIWLIKFNVYGGIEWKRTYAGSNGETINQIIQTRDGGYAFVGWSASHDYDATLNHGLADCWIVKIDANGNIQWQRSIGGSQSDEGISIAQTSDNNFVIGGTTSSNDGDMAGIDSLGQYWVFKIKEDGSNILWKTYYSGSFTYLGRFNDLKIGEDGSIYTLLTNGSIDGDFKNEAAADQYNYISKMDPNGNKIWIKGLLEHLGNVNIPFTKMLLIKGGGFYVIGDYLGYPFPPALTRLDAQAGLIWTRTIPEPAPSTSPYNNMVSMCYSADSTSIIMLGSWKKDLSLIPYLIKITTIDTAANVMGQLLYSSPRGSAEVFPFALVNLGNSNVFVGSDENGYTSGNYDVLVAKTGMFNTIVGKAFLDANGNGIWDTGERAYDNCKITSTNNGVASAESRPNNGIFKIEVDTGISTVNIIPDRLYYNVVPSSKTSHFASYYNTDSISFAITPILNKQDLTMHIFPLSRSRPGYITTCFFNYSNVGTDTILNGTVQWIKDKAMNVVYASINPDLVNGDTLTWNYTHLTPLENRAIYLSMELNSNLVKGDTIIFSASVNPITGDQTPLDNYSRLRATVSSSIDPNDKQENLAGRMDLSKLSTDPWIDYFIRFQNTGNDTAFKIVVVDTLDKHLDWSSLQMTGASQPYSLSIKNRNRLEWTFNNVNLPDSFANEPASHGYLAYRIKANPTLQAGDVIQNTAQIYFDFNSPVTTNTAFTTVRSTVVTGLSDLYLRDLSFKIVPNPNKGQLSLVINGKQIGHFDITVYDLTGKVLSSSQLTRTNPEISQVVPLNIGNLSSGFYYISIQKNGKIISQKMVIQ